MITEQINRSENDFEEPFSEEERAINEYCRRFGEPPEMEELWNKD